MSEQGPEDGHTFRITFESRGSYGLAGESHTDALEYLGPVHMVEVRAWSLRAALKRAIKIPFADLMGTEWTNEPRLVRELARRCYNGAEDPWQEFYDRGYAPMLEAMADRLEQHQEQHHD